MAGNDHINSQLFTHMWRHQTEILSIVCIFVINSCNKQNLMNIDYLNKNSFNKFLNTKLEKKFFIKC